MRRAAAGQVVLRPEGAPPARPHTTHTQRTLRALRANTKTPCLGAQEYQRAAHVLESSAEAGVRTPLAQFLRMYALYLVRTRVRARRPALLSLAGCCAPR